jgi:hypothetical protein
MARAYVEIGRVKDAEREFEEAEKLRQYYRQGKTQLADCMPNCRPDRSRRHGLNAAPFFSLTKLTC